MDAVGDDEGWEPAVRRQLALGRLLPLGDGAWITEAAVADVLRLTAAAVPGVVLESVRLRPAETPAPGPVRVEGGVAATADRPLPVTAAALRGALRAALEDRVGLAAGAIDLRMTALLDAAPAPPPRTVAGPPGAAPADPLGAAALAVPGVARLAPVLRGRTAPTVQIAVATGHRARDVAAAVRAAVAPAEVVVTALDAGSAPLGT
ncbi:hypothetical protein AB0K09_22730 [Streptomyces sp. NPDC049577]|uniref:hypothetical protein n=1 Tax=Streptomyces sp. NPDC049577 TaxID=3155153 RepID=UPI0034262B0A